MFLFKSDVSFLTVFNLLQYINDTTAFTFNVTNFQLLVRHG